MYLLFPSLSITGSLRSSVQAELQQQEDLLYKERKERERIIASYRRKVEEHKARAEKVDRRVRMITYLHRNILCVICVLVLSATLSH